MHRKSGAFAAFAGKGFVRREFFPHAAVAIPKVYPDSQVLLERRGLTRDDLARGQFHQLNLYTTDTFDLPAELFADPEINWHRQQLGQAGLIAAAGFWICGSVATVSLLQSDLCQQLYRHASLKHPYKSRIENRFGHWYALLFNALLDFCIDRGVATVHSPTGQQIVDNTRKQISPELFFRIYDYPEDSYQCRKISVGAAQYWEIPVEANRAAVVRLTPEDERPAREPAGTQICVFHDLEENIDTDISPAECADNLSRMLEIEKSFGMSATYNVLGLLFDRKKAEIQSSDPNHSIGFHSFNHDLSDLAQLPRCRGVDLRVRGYRPPQSRITPELTDYGLTRLNFEWFASSVRSLGHADCRLANGIVKLPIDRDDYALSLGKSYGQWEEELLDRARSVPFFGLGLHDCYAGTWLAHYPDLLGKLAAIGQLVRADDVCDRMFLAEGAAAPP